MTHPTCLAYWLCECGNEVTFHGETYRHAAGLIVAPCPRCKRSMVLMWDVGFPEGILARVPAKWEEQSCQSN
jgi:hypothetical protein